MIRTHIQPERLCARSAAVVLATVALLLAGCPAAFVSPYDQKLVDETDALYRKAASMTSKGIAVSPKMTAERAVIRNPPKHPGHYSAFKPAYDELLVDTDALVLRAMSGSTKIDSRGKEIQKSLAEQVDSLAPSQCPELQAQLSDLSLTAARFVALKCLLLTWQKEHDDMEGTDGTRILNKADWELRRLNLFRAVLAIQQAERFKKIPSSK